MKLFFIIAGLKLFSSFEFECDLIKKMVYLNIYIIVIRKIFIVVRATRSANELCILVAVTYKPTISLITKELRL